MEDKNIIELFFQRSERAIEELSCKYGKLLKSIAYNILHDRQDADECENDTYLKTWNSIPPTRPECLSAYICRIVRNAALSRWKYNNRKKRNAEMDMLLLELSECIPGKDDVEAAADDTIMQAVNAFLRTLDTETQIMFVRRYFYMDSVQSLAKQFGIHASSVSTKLNRVRMKLRRHLEEEGIVI